MTRPTQPQTLTSFAGSVLIGPGLFLQFGHLLGAAAQLSHLFGKSAGEGLGVLSIVLALSYGHQQLVHNLLQIFWPVFLIIVGAVLLCYGSTDQDNAAGA
jgi:hypothetical protein